MRKSAFASAIFATTVISLAGFAVAQSAGGAVQSLRGGEVGDQLAVQDNYPQMEIRFNRNFRLQPPLISHSIAKYQIDLKANRCLSCHDWTTAADEEAPIMSMTHYMDRDGNQLDHVSGSRWFCNQCHVPQADAPELVENTFLPSSSK